MYTRSMETIYLSLVHTVAEGTVFMKSPVGHVLNTCSDYFLKKHSRILFKEHTAEMGNGVSVALSDRYYSHYSFYGYFNLGYL